VVELIMADECRDFLLKNIESELHIINNTSRLNVHKVISESGFLVVLVIQYLELYEQLIASQPSLCLLTISYYKKCLDLHRSVEQNVAAECNKDDLYGVLNFYSNSVFKFAQCARMTLRTVTEEECVSKEMEETSRGLFCLSGGCLAEIRNRITGKRRFCWRRKPITTMTSTNRVLLDIITAIKMNDLDKVELPQSLKYRDRGQMFFAKSCFLPFIKNLNHIVLNHTTSKAVKTHGKNLLKVF
jgi:hypothetical protein